ncbi:hypothetical protein ACKI1K_29365, partial [Streptomyces scabiei]|uniref:hypothetical protein n=1 Tax=Streptomyces scabiei TaxID=1930 RepID=UPI0038F5DC21
PSTAASPQHVSNPNNPIYTARLTDPRQRAAWLCQFLWELFHGGFGSHSAGFSVINNGEF